MARITLSLPLAFTEVPAGAIRWEDQAGFGDVSGLATGGGPASLTRFMMRPTAQGRVLMQINGSGAGPDLTSAWEASPVALTLRVHGVSDLVIPGPAHPSSANLDSTEPYGWRVSASSVAAHAAWRAAFLALPPEQQAATLVLDDGVVELALAGVVRTRIGVRGALTAVVGHLTTDGDVLDEVCWQHYGREDLVPTVLAANPGLAQRGPLLPAGVAVVLPDSPPPHRLAAVIRLADAAPSGVAIPETRPPLQLLGGIVRTAIRVHGP